MVIVVVVIGNRIAQRSRCHRACHRHAWIHRLDRATLRIIGCLATHSGTDCKNQHRNRATAQQ